MPTLVIKGKITKEYNHWVKVFDDVGELRESKYGIKTIYRGHELDDESTIHVGFTHSKYGSSSGTYAK